MSAGLLLFAAVLALVVYAVVRAAREAAARRRLQTEHPAAPWMWRRDWADRAVRDENAVRTGFLWFFAITWILVTTPALLAFRDRATTDRAVTVFLLLFPLVGVGVLVAAAYQTLRRRKYGVSVCRIERLPIAVGSLFRGEVQARVHEIPQNGFQAQLTCVRRVVTGSGKNRSTHETILWQDEKTIGNGAAMPNPDGMRIPVHFTIPPECEQTDESNPRDSVLWRLEVRADVPGIDYSARFELPVFGVAESLERDDWPAAVASAWTPPQHIVFGLSRTGGEEILIRPTATFGDWFGYLFFLTLWFGALAFAGSFNAPRFILVIFGIIGLVVLLGAADLLVGRTAISADRQSLTVRRTWLGLGPARTFPASDIEAVAPRIGTTSGSRARYKVEARMRDGKTRTIAKYLLSRRDAEGVAARVDRALGH